MRGQSTQQKKILKRSLPLPTLLIMEYCSLLHTLTDIKLYFIIMYTIFIFFYEQDSFKGVYGSYGTQPLCLSAFSWKLDTV